MSCVGTNLVGILFDYSWNSLDNGLTCRNSYTRQALRDQKDAARQNQNAGSKIRPGPTRLVKPSNDNARSSSASPSPSPEFVLVG